MKLLVLAALVGFSQALVPISLWGPASERIPDEYIVQFEETARPAFEAFKAKRGGAPFEVQGLYEIGDFMGFAAKVSEHQLPYLQSMEGVKTIEPNAMAYALGQQVNPPYGLDRIDQRQLPYNNLYRWDDNAAGSGVRVYVLDTGVDTRHPAYEGRAFFSADCANRASCLDSTQTQNPLDRQGHGTHCAGTVASGPYGVAKNATVHSVKVLGDNGSGSFQGIIAGVQFVVNDRFNGPKIISQSLGGGRLTALDNAVNAAHRAGVVNVVAAGNSNSDACNGSPSGASEAITVANSDSNDRKAGTSSWGRCVDLYAPGTAILSTYPNGRTATISGTSMACPHVAGYAAILASKGLNANQIRQEIVNTATPNVISGNRGDTPNRLLFTNPSTRR